MPGKLDRDLIDQRANHMLGCISTIEELISQPTHDDGKLRVLQIQNSLYGHWIEIGRKPAELAKPRSLETACHIARSPETGRSGDHMSSRGQKRQRANRRGWSQLSLVADPSFRIPIMWQQVEGQEIIKNKKSVVDEVAGIVPCRHVGL